MERSVSIRTRFHRLLGSIRSAIDVAPYGGDVGTYRFEFTGPRSARLIFNNPYPCDSYDGIISAMIYRFTPAGATPHIQHLDISQNRTRKGVSCTYNVTW